MKKWEQDALWWVAIAVISISIMTFLNPEIFSWSDNAFRVLNSFLNGALASFMAVFLVCRYNHPQKESVIIDLFRWRGRRLVLRFKTFCFALAIGFFSIMIFSLNIPGFPEWPHMFATGVTVGMLVLFASRFYKMWSKLWWKFNICFLVSGLCLAVAFMYQRHLVKFPEFALAFFGLVFLYLSRKESLNHSK